MKLMADRCFAANDSMAFSAVLSPKAYSAGSAENNRAASANVIHPRGNAANERASAASVVPSSFIGGICPE
jgi:hypothetical protein